MLHESFGHALHALGLTTTAFWPREANIQNPKDVQRHAFNPDARSPEKRYGPGASTAKGWPDSYPHGANLDPINAVVRHPSNPLNLADNDSFTVMGHRQHREDLNFVEGAYKRLLAISNQLGGGPVAPPTGPPGPPAADLAPRVEAVETRLAQLEKQIAGLLEK